jgi:ATP-binding cassette subfamily C protein LapB
VLRVTVANVEIGRGALLPPASAPATGHVGAPWPTLLLATLLVSLLSLALPIALLQVYDRILPQAATGTLVVLALAVGVAVLLELGLRIVRGDVLSRMAAAAEARAHALAMDRIAGTPASDFDRHGNGWYSERLNAIGTLREAWSGPALQAILDLPFALIYLLAIWLIAGPLVAGPAAALGCVLLIGLAVGRITRRRAACLAAAEERRFNFLFDVLRGLDSLKLLGAERLLERRYERLQGTSAALRRDLAAATAGAQEGGMLFAHLATIGTAALGCLMAVQGTLTIGGLSACTMLAGRSMQPLLGGVALWARWQMLADARRRLDELAALPREERPVCPPLALRAGAISLRGVRVGPPYAPLFKGLNLDIPAGGFVAITGPNGSGRTALLRLIAGEIEAEAGRVLVDGQNLAFRCTAGARADIALVAPDPALIGGTLMENITLRQPALELRALSFAVALGLDGVAAALPGGWHTQVGPGGVPLARGVRQRIGLVRALAQEPRILLLDDVTAQLDADGDRRLGQVLAGLRGRATILLVSHRRSILATADRVLHIAGGRLVEAPP